jgi:hypothetical protein
MICDWHYDRPRPTPVYFAMKGLSVITCPWNSSDSAVLQVDDMFRFRQYATSDMKERYQGLLQTVWNDTGAFLDAYYGKSKPVQGDEAACFRAAFEEIQKRVTER